MGGCVDIVPLGLDSVEPTRRFGRGNLRVVIGNLRSMDGAGHSSPHFVLLQTFITEEEISMCSEPVDPLTPQEAIALTKV